jgi:hypothetical protein
MRGQIIEKTKGVWLVRVESKRNDIRKSVSKQIRGTRARRGKVFNGLAARYGQRRFRRTFAPNS